MLPLFSSNKMDSFTPIVGGWNTVQKIKRCRTFECNSEANHFSKSKYFIMATRLTGSNSLRLAYLVKKTTMENLKINLGRGQSILSCWRPFFWRSTFWNRVFCQIRSPRRPKDIFAHFNIETDMKFFDFYIFCCCQSVWGGGIALYSSLHPKQNQLLVFKFGSKNDPLQPKIYRKYKFKVVPNLIPS